MLGELSTALKGVNESHDARCLLLSAEGKVFSAGHNLKELVYWTFHCLFEQRFNFLAFIDQGNPKGSPPARFCNLHRTDEVDA